MNTQFCITGLGVCSAIGNTTQSFADRLRKGGSGIQERCDIFPNHKIWAGLSQLEEGTDQPAGVDRAALLAFQAVLQAWLKAFGPGKSQPDTSRVALILGTSHGGRSQIDHCLESPHTFETGEASVRILEVSPHFRQTEFVARRIGINGPVVTISTACSSSSAAVLYGMDLLSAGKVDYVVAGGMDGFSKLTHAGFRALGAVSDGACGPFSERIGISLGEGAAVVVLERLEDAIRRQADVWAELYGGGSSWDCYHITEPEPSGDGLVRALEMAALRGAISKQREFSYMSLHGTGTRANDAAETIALKRFFDNSTVPPASSVKSFTGHTLGASGAMGLIASVLGMRHDFLPPTANYNGIRAGCDLDYIPNESRQSKIHSFATQSAGFGGVNVVLMGGLQRKPAQNVPAPECHIVLSGVGVVSAAGIGMPAFRANLLAGQTGIALIDRFDVSGRRAQLAGLVRDFNPRKIAPTLNLRRVDLCFQYAAVAVAEALAASRVEQRGIDCPKIGLVVGTTRGAVSSFENSMTNVMGGAWDKTSAIHFPNLVMSSLGGYVSKIFNLQGAASTLVCGNGGGLQAIIHAWELLRSNPTQQAVVVVLADELSPMFFRMFDETGSLACGTDVSRGLVYGNGLGGVVMGEGAAAFVLEKRDSGVADGEIVLSGSGMTSDSEPGAGLQMSGAWLRDSIRQAMIEAAITADEINLIYGHGSGSCCRDKRELTTLEQLFKPSVPLCCVTPNTGLAESASSGFSMAAAALSLQHGEAYPVALLSPSSITWNFVRPKPIQLNPRNVLLTSSSDAGCNSALVLSRQTN